MLTVMPVSKREGSRKGITVREGSVAQARREAGLTLAQVADGQLERAAGILQQFGKAEKLRDAHIAYAELLDGRQDVATAGRHWKLAAEIGRLAALGFEWRAVTNENGEPRSAAGRRTY